MREIKKMIKGHKAVDGAGVHLVRVLGYYDVKDFDPFLMLDSFDSRNPDDYIKGFPMHPHRGIETITYLIEGEINHKDSLGNKGTVHSGEAQMDDCRQRYFASRDASACTANVGASDMAESCP
jgi:redox-sensitive bicupin YhaK (pirin superfamily)